MIVEILLKYPSQSALCQDYQQLADNLRQTGIAIQVMYFRRATHFSGVGMPLKKV